MMVAINVKYNTLSINTTGTLTASSSTISTSDAFINSINAKVDTIGALDLVGTVNALSITGDVLSAHVASGSTYGVVEGLTDVNTSLGENTLNIVTTGIDNVVFGDNLGNLITAGNSNILFGGDVDADATNRISFGGTNTVDNSLLINSSVTQLKMAGLGSTSSNVYLAYNAGAIGPTTTPALLVSGGTLTGNLDMGGNKITNVGTPLADTDGATVDYTISVSGGLDPKESCHYATLANITNFTVKATVEAALDPVSAVAPTLIDGDRVLVKNQTVQTENGIYWWQTTELVRAPDQDGTPASEVSGGNFTFIESGDTLATTGWVLQGNGVLTLGVDNLIWVIFTSVSSITAVNVGTGAGTFKSRTGNTLQSRSLIGTTGVVAVQNTDDVTLTNNLTISSAGGSTLINTGSGAALSIKGITAGTNVSLTVNANDLVVNSSVALVIPAVATAVVERNYNGLTDGPDVYPITTNLRKIAYTTISHDDIGISLSGGDIVLPAGTYECQLITSASYAYASYITLLDGNDNTIATSLASDNTANIKATVLPTTTYNFTLSGSTTIQSLIAVPPEETYEPAMEIYRMMSPSFGPELTFDINSLTNVTVAGAFSQCQLAFARNNDWLALSLVETTTNLTVIAVFDYNLNKLEEIAFGGTTPKCKIIWGFNNATTLFTVYSSDVRAFSFDGETLSLTSSVIGVIGFSKTCIDIRTVAGSDDVLAIVDTTPNLVIVTYISSTLAAPVTAAQGGGTGRINAMWKPNSETLYVARSADVSSYTWTGAALNLIGTSASTLGGDPESSGFSPDGTYCTTVTAQSNRTARTFSVSDIAAPVLMASSSTITGSFTGFANSNAVNWDYTRSYTISRVNAGIVMASPYYDPETDTVLVNGKVPIAVSGGWTADSTGKDTFCSCRTQNVVAYTMTSDELLHITNIQYYLPQVVDEGIQLTSAQFAIRKIA
tara:strand:- start:8595 stop:11447 length:2853 start_codon:yes stop_codon:yes gene_type:complete